MVRVLSSAALILLATACSRTELAYRHADRLIEYYAWQTVAISSSQRRELRPLLESMLQRHREQELPLVITYLDLAERFARNTDGSAGAACLVDGAGQLYLRHARLAVELSAPLLAQLDDDQTRKLAAYTARRQRDAVEVYLDPDPERRQKSRQQRFVERIERWTGALDDNQLRLVHDALERIPDLSAPWLAYRSQQTAGLVDMLEAGKDLAAVQAYLDGWWVQRDGRSAEYRQRWRTATAEFVQLMNGLAVTLSDNQRTTLVTRLSELREDLAAFVPDRRQAASLPLVPSCASGAV